MSLLLSGCEMGGGETGAISEEPGAGGKGEALYLHSWKHKQIALILVLNMYSKENKYLNVL